MLTQPFNLKEAQEPSKPKPTSAWLQLLRRVGFDLSSQIGYPFLFSDAPVARIRVAVCQKRPAGPWLQLDYLRRLNVFARANFAEQLFARGGVEIQYGDRGTASLISAELYRGGVDVLLCVLRDA